MTQEDSSLQSQNPVSSAQNSIDNVHNAVSQAQSHPKDETVEGAQNAIGQAERAIAQARGAGNATAVNQASEELGQEKSELQNVMNRQ
jgi:hypothetical protein